MTTMQDEMDTRMRRSALLCELEATMQPLAGRAATEIRNTIEELREAQEMNQRLLRIHREMVEIMLAKDGQS